ncbi:MAG TPA: tRNA pseudouridine(38-40) synthase TruA [Thermomicrobiaceae bacterium]|nr:tRNA pseudouridine(38-40) synthase TruA [Thermomicrobiaceae bacterium]
MVDDARWFRIDLGYDGAAFLGSQRQPGARTVQETVERAVAEVSGQHVTVTLAGRTDRGVHATGQVGSFSIRWARSADALARALQAMTPDDLVVRDVREVPGGFHARFDARMREYRYRIWNGPVPPVLLRDRVWWVRRPLVVERMARAALMLVGTHDFASFAGNGVGVPGAGVDTARTVSRVEWQELTEAIEPADGERLLEFQIVADGFLPHMVRNLVGALARVGWGLAEPESLSTLLAARDRRLAPEPAPPAGLTLWKVWYPDIVVDADIDRYVGVEGNEDVFAEGE